MKDLKLWRAFTRLNQAVNLMDLVGSLTEEQLAGIAVAEREEPPDYDDRFNEQQRIVSDWVEPRCRATRQTVGLDGAFMDSCVRPEGHKGPHCGSWLF